MDFFNNYSRFSQQIADRKQAIETPTSKTNRLTKLVLKTSMIIATFLAFQVNATAATTKDHRTSQQGQLEMLKGVDLLEFNLSAVKRIKVESKEQVPALPPYDFSQQPGIKLHQPAEKLNRKLQQSQVMKVDLDARIEYNVSFDENEFASIAAELRSRGFAEASQPISPKAETDATQAYGWSNGWDSRIRKGIADGYSMWENSLRRMGQVNGGCTGTLIGRRLVLTAAHCVVNSNLTWPTQTYRARRDGATLPYGTEYTRAIYYDNQWVANNCHITYNGATHDKCVRWDWAVMVLRSNAWSGVPSPGWMGFRYAGESTLENYAIKHDGYPTCSNYGAQPKNCTWNTAYGQTFNCSINYFGQSNTLNGATPIGYKLTFRHSCDMSRGHSGGPVYTYSGGSNGPYVLGVNVWEHCYDCKNKTGGVKTHPNKAVRIKPWLGNFLLNLRSIHP